MGTTKKILVSMSEKTLTDIEMISNNIGDSNRSSVVAKAIRVLKFIVEEEMDGGKLLVEGKDGEIDNVKIIGL